MEAIHRVGPGGHYLNDDHTFQHFRKIFSPKLLVRDRYEIWEQKGKETLGETIRKKVIEVLETHQCTPLSEDMDRTVREMIKSMEARSRG